MTREIPLTQGKVALVDDEDFERVSQLKWAAYCPNQKRGGTTFYAITGSHKKGSHIQMHRLVTNALKGEIVDHWDSDGLNNQKHNLRKCTNAQNLHNRGPNKNNTSGFKGAYYDKTNGRWKSKINADGTQINIGYFDTAEDAGRAYDTKAKELFGEFAKLNFSDD